MLETPEESVRLLKAGIDGKTIEKLYLTYNNFRIVGNAMFPELVEIDTKENKDMAISQEAVAELKLVEKDRSRIIVPNSCINDAGEGHIPNG